MKIPYLILLVLVFSCSVFGQAVKSDAVSTNEESLADYKKDKWFLLQRKSKTSLFAINPAKITRSGEITFVWIQEIDIESLKESSEGVKDYQMIRWKVKCDAQELSASQVYTYKNKKLSDSRTIEDAPFISPPPNSVGEEVIKNACQIADLKANGLKER